MRRWLTRMAVATALSATLCAWSWAQDSSSSLGQQRASRTAELAAQAREWNALLLQFGDRMRGTEKESRRAVQLQSDESLRERARVLRELVRTDPAEALKVMLDERALAVLRESFREESDLLEQHGEWEGPVDTVVMDGEDLEQHEVVHHLHYEGETLEIRLAGPQPEGIGCGAWVRFRGVRIGEVVAAAEAEIAPADGAPSKSGERAAAAACGPRGPQNIAVLLATFPGISPPAGVTPAQVHSILFGTAGRSLHGYWNEASYGQTSATGTVLGWYTLDRVYSCSEYYAMRNAAIASADADIDFRNYNRLFILFPNPGGCSWAGLSNVGCSSFGSAEGTISASSSWMLAHYFANTDNGVKLSAHEGGHALGLMHARSRQFAGEPLGAPGAAGTISEYGDGHSAMGFWNLGHYNVEQKIRLGWLTSANVQQVQSAGVYTLKPIEMPVAGAQALQVQRGSGSSNWLWLEYRQPLGNYDTTLAQQIFSGALVHYKDATTGSYTDLLDFTPATSNFSDAALAAGSAWQDPYTNLTLSVAGASSSGLTVNVGYGIAACTEAAPTLTLSPPNPSAQPGGNASYTATLRNNDSASCGSRTFSFASTLPQGWTTTFSNPGVTLAPGQTVSITMTKTVPPSAAPGTYGVNITAQSSSGSVSATANITILSACTQAAPALSLSPSNPSAQPGATVSWSLSIRNNDSSSCSSRSFSLSSSQPTGWGTTFSSQSLTLAPGQSATVTMTKSVPGSTPSGTYTVNATAQSSQSSTSATASVTVQAPTSNSTPLTVAFQQTVLTTSNRSSLVSTVRVLSGTAPVAGAAVTFALRKPDGSTETSRAIQTDSAGLASWTYWFQKKDPTGFYTLTATATHSGRTASASTSLTRR